MQNTAPRYALTALLLAAPAVHAAEPSLMPDSTSDQITKTSSGQTMHSKVYVAGKRMRIETTPPTAQGESGPAHTMTMIMDTDAKKIWMLAPPPINCIEQPMSPDAKAKWTTSETGVKEELLGTETVDGHPTQKFRITTTAKGRPIDQLVWKATDLKNFPIKQAAADGSYSSEFKNVKLGTPDAKLFKQPADCKPMGSFAIPHGDE